MNNKKGQAAMEFLMTYGWAILVVLIAIGALAYFGVLSPERFLPTSCTLGTGFACDEFKASAAAASNVEIYLRNGIGSSITISGGDVTLTEQDSDTCTAVTENGAAADAGDETLADGARGQWVWTCNDIDANSADSKFKADISFTYTAGGETLSHDISGSMTTRVE